jgi:hypothetical protein
VALLEADERAVRKSSVTIKFSLDPKEAYTPGMEVYERETTEIVNRFLRHRLSFPECIGALDAALADLIPRLTGDQIARLRIVMLANNEIVMKEMERRGSPD